MSTEQSEWRHPGAIAKVSLILSHKDLAGLEHNQFDAKKPRQDSSIKNPANSLELLCLCREKRSVFGKN